MKKALIIILTALLVLSAFVSCEGDIEDMFGKTVSFNGNGSTSGQMAEMKVKKGEEVTLPANEFTRTDYVFAGWNTQADGSGTGYADKANASFEDNTTLYAQWVDELTITFNANDKSETPATKTQKVGKGIETALDANTFTFEGCYFAGWSSSALGDVEYADMTKITLSADKTLYAVWSDKPVVTLSKGTGIREVTGAGSYAPGATVSLDATMDEGYKWSKWTQTTGGADVSTTKAYSFEMGTQNIAYTANAEPISYSVEFNKNSVDATGTMANQNFTYDAAQNLTANAYSWESHSFTGWNTSSDGQGTSYADGASVSNLTTTDGATVTLYAQWSEGPNLIKSTTEAITLSSGDWTIEDTTVTVGGRITISGTVNLLLPDGKTLNANSGITVSEGNTLVIDKFDSESTGTGILIATAETFEYGKNYAGIGGGNGGAGGTITVKYGTVTATGGVSAAGIGGGNKGSGGIITISDTADVTATGGSGAAGIGGGKYSSSHGTLAIGEGIGLFGGENKDSAVFISGPTESYTGDRYNYMKTDATTLNLTVTFNANGGGGSMAAQSVPSGVSAKLTANTFTSPEADKIFAGWTTGSDGSGTYYGDKETVTLTENLVLYAQWAIDLYATKQTAWEAEKDTLYSLSADTEITSRITVTGSVTLILPKDKTLTATEGITVSTGDSLTIGGEGTLTATGSLYAAGIGGGYNRAGGTITINDGTVTANGGENAAGIGGGVEGVGGTVTIAGGTVTATGGSATGLPASGSGIGAGSSNNPSHGTLTIGSGVSVTVSTDNTNWSPYNGSRTQYMKANK